MTLAYTSQNKTKDSTKIPHKNSFSNPFNKWNKFRERNKTTTRNSVRKLMQAKWKSFILIDTQFIHKHIDTLTHTARLYKTFRIWRQQKKFSPNQIPIWSFLFFDQKKHTTKAFENVHSLFLDFIAKTNTYFQVSTFDTTKIFKKINCLWFWVGKMLLNNSSTYHCHHSVELTWMLKVLSSSKMCNDVNRPLLRKSKEWILSFIILFSISLRQ